MIRIVEGNVLEAKEKVICHQVNTRGVMGSSKDNSKSTNVAHQLRMKYGDALYLPYKEVCDKGNALGKCLILEMTDGKVIANMFAQGNYGYDKAQYTDYKAFENSLRHIVNHCLNNSISAVAMPFFIGCARGGGDWSTVYDLLDKYFGMSSTTDLTLYKLAK